MLFRRFLSVTPDGRTSLKYKLSQNNFSQFKENWLRDPSTYPIMGIIALASTCATGFGIHFLMNEPDVTINKEHRQQIIRDNYEEGENWKYNGFFKYFKNTK